MTSFIEERIGQEIQHRSGLDAAIHARFRPSHLPLTDPSRKKEDIRKRPLSCLFSVSIRWPCLEGFMRHMSSSELYRFENELVSEIQSAYGEQGVTLPKTGRSFGMFLYFCSVGEN